MNNISIKYYFNKNQYKNISWIKDIVDQHTNEQHTNKIISCPLCHGLHQNDTQCQRND